MDYGFPFIYRYYPIQFIFSNCNIIYLYNNHYTTAITYIKPHLDPMSAIGSSFLYI